MHLNLADECTRVRLRLTILIRFIASEAIFNHNFNSLLDIIFESKKHIYAITNLINLTTKTIFGGYYLKKLCI